MNLPRKATNNTLNPLKSNLFYGGVALGVSAWFGIKVPDFIQNYLLKLPAFWLVFGILIFIILHVISQCAPPKISLLATGDKNNFGPFLAGAISKPGHAILGCGCVALLHCFHTSTASYNLQLFIICLCVAPIFYWHAWGIQQLIKN